jgi:hypothetical protein
VSRFRPCRAKALDETLVPLNVSRLATTLPILDSAINQPERERDDRASHDASSELSQTISVLTAGLQIAEHPYDDAHREQAQCDYQQKCGMAETPRLMTDVHPRDGTGTPSRRRGPNDARI